MRKARTCVKFRFGRISVTSTRSLLLSCLRLCRELPVLGSSGRNRTEPFFETARELLKFRWCLAGSLSGNHGTLKKSRKTIRVMEMTIYNLEELFARGLPLTATEIATVSMNLSGGHV